MKGELNIMSIKIIKAFLQAFQYNARLAYTELGKFTQKPNIPDFRFYLNYIWVFIELDEFLL